MNKRRLLPIIPILCVILMGASDCDVKSSPTTNAPGFEGETVTPQGPPSCSITERGQNSKRQYYVAYGCTDGQRGAHILSGPNDLPNCRVGTFWDACAK